MKILCSGGLGFIGSHLVEALIEQGHRVFVYDDLSSGSLENLPKDLEEPDIESDRPSWAYVDMGDISSSWENLVVYHLAANADIGASMKDPFEYFRKEMRLIHLLLWSAVGTADRFIFASSSSVYAQRHKMIEDVTPLCPETPYAASKMAGEALVHMAARQGLPCLSVRPMNVYGPRQRTTGSYVPVVPAFMMTLLRDDPVPIDGDGTQSVDLIYVRDAAAWLAELATVDPDLLYGQPVNLGRGVSVPVINIARLCANALGKELKIEYHPAREWHFRHSEADTTRMMSLCHRLCLTSLRDGMEIAGRYYEACQSAENLGEEMWRMVELEG